MSVDLHAENTIATIVKAMLPASTSKSSPWAPSSEPSKALYLMLDMRASYYPPRDDDEDWPGEMSAGRDVHIIVERPTNYTKVWIAVNTSWAMPKCEAFLMQSDHDSCWRSDGFREISRIWREMSSELVGQGAVSSDIRHFNTIRKIAWMTITYEPIDRSNTYMKRITSIHHGAP